MTTLSSVAVGDIILAAHHNQLVELLTAIGTGQPITLNYDAAGSLIIQPATNPAASTNAFTVKNAAGTTLGSITYDAEFRAATLFIASQKVVTEYNAGNSGTAITIDWTNGDTQALTLTGNAAITFTNPIAGRTYTLILVQDGTGTRIPTYSPTPYWVGGAAPTLTTTATTGRDVLTFFYSGVLAKYLGVSALAFA